MSDTRAYWENIETGMVRRFWNPPRHGKWRPTTRKEAKPIGRKAMAALLSAKGGDTP